MRHVVAGLGDEPARVGRDVGTVVGHVGESAPPGLLLIYSQRVRATSVSLGWLRSNCICPTAAGRNQSGRPSSLLANFIYVVSRLDFPRSLSAPGNSRYRANAGLIPRPLTSQREAWPESYGWHISYRLQLRVLQGIPYASLRRRSNPSGESLRVRGSTGPSSCAKSSCINHKDPYMEDGSPIVCPPSSPLVAR